MIRKLVLLSTILLFTGCVDEDKEKNLYPSKPLINIKSFNVLDGGSKMVWDVDIDNNHQDTIVRISPWNDTTYSLIFFQDYKNSIDLKCNYDFGEINGFVKCNDITSVTCRRNLMSGEYSEFTCNYMIKDNITVIPEEHQTMRAPTFTNQNDSEETLLNISTKYLEEVAGNERPNYSYDSERNESKMYNVYTSGMGSLGN